MILGKILHQSVFALFYLIEAPGANLYVARKLRIEDKGRKVLEFEVILAYKVKLIKMVKFGQDREVGS